MATKIPRNTAVIFGGTVGAVPGGIGVFGSLAAGTPTESINLAVIQAAAAWSGGWGSALVNNFPAQEDLNSIPFVLSQQIAEILQDGIPPYDAGTTYFTNSFCQSGGNVYQSLSDNNIGNTPPSSQWALFSSNVFSGELSAPIIGASQNNYNPAGWSSNIYNLIVTNNSGGNIDITGLIFKTNGQLINIFNNSAGGNTITLKQDNGSSSAANRFYVGGDLVIPAKNLPAGILDCAQLYYSNVYQHWVLLAKNF